jgi:hypothetical protein
MQGEIVGDMSEMLIRLFGKLNNGIKGCQNLDGLLCRLVKFMRR